MQSINTEAIVDIIFIHGLGGSAKGTWTHAESNEFWPAWLHSDSKFKNVRISTFSYDSNYGNILAPKNGLGISDFAKHLLDSLDFHFQKYGDVNNTFQANSLIAESHHFCIAQHRWISC